MALQSKRRANINQAFTCLMRASNDLIKDHGPLLDEEWYQLAAAGVLIGKINGLHYSRKKAKEATNVTAP